MLCGLFPPYQIKNPVPAIPSANVIVAIKDDLWMFFSTMLPIKAADIPKKKIAKLNAHSVAPFEKPM